MVLADNLTRFPYMARNEGHEGTESLQSSLESCKILSFFGETLLDDRCYRSLQALSSSLATVVCNTEEIKIIKKVCYLENFHK